MLSIQVQFILYENKVHLKTEKSSEFQRIAIKKRPSVLSNLESVKICEHSPAPFPVFQSCVGL